MQKYSLSLKKILRASYVKRHEHTFSDNLNTNHDVQHWHKPHGQYTGIEIFNTTARRKVPLVIPNNNYITWYSCGPTVYDSSHLGHASCYVKLDIIQRILRDHFKYNLVTAMNITDIDDKIIRRSEESGRDWRELARGYEAEFWSDLRKLNVANPNLKLRVTDHMPQITKFIENLVRDNKAYVADTDKSVYFNVKECQTYGKLQKLSTTTAQDEQKDNAIGGKLAPEDFVLWKAKKRPDEPSWPSPWGAGRPGWHIECSTLASLIFGGVIDFHAGGLDLRFPHHENEEAQSCAYHNTNQWVNYWLHTGQLHVKGDDNKMSKSLQNTISVSSMLDQYTADDFRMACLLSNYRNSMAYCDQTMETASRTLQKFETFNLDCDAYLSGCKRSQAIDANVLQEQLNFAIKEVDASLCDDFDTARAMTILMDEISNVSRVINANEKTLNQLETAGSCLDGIAAVQNFVQQTLKSFGITSIGSRLGEICVEEITSDSIDLSVFVEDLLNTRKRIRERAITTNNGELFKICDELRNCLLQNGIEVRDHSQGSTWKFIAHAHKK